MSPYLQEFNPQPDARSAIIMLPDIYGATEYAQQTTRDFAAKFASPAYLLDYFYQLSKKPNAFTPEQAEQAHTLMEQMKGEDFLAIFEQAVDLIANQNPVLTEIIVIGFCFAGRLAYLAGAEPKVNKIVSFYGAGAHRPDFVAGQTALEFLCAKRAATDLSVLSFYGSQDDSIPESDRAKTSADLLTAKIAYTEKIYDAGHAYFQPGRPNYNESAASQSWQNLREFIG